VRILTAILVRERSALSDPYQWRGERYDGTSTRTGPLQSKKKYKIELRDNAKNE